MEEKNYISSVKLPESDVKYYFKDLDAQALLDFLFQDEIIIDCGTAEETDESFIINCGTAEKYID